MERAGLNYFGPCQPQTLPRLLGASQAQAQGLRVGGQVSHLSSLRLPAVLPSVPPFQSRIPGPPPRLGARGGASPSIPSSGRGSDLASRLGSGPQGSGPGPQETPRGQSPRPAPSGRRMWEARGGGAAAIPGRGAAEGGGCPRGLGAARRRVRALRPQRGASGRPVG